MQGSDTRLRSLQDTGQLGIKGQDIPAELKQLPLQLPHLLQPLADLLRSQPISAAICYHDDFLQHIHRTVSAQHADQSSCTGPAESSSQTSASSLRFPAVQQMRSVDGSAASHAGPSTQKWSQMQPEDAEPFHPSSHQQPAADLAPSNPHFEDRTPDAARRPPSAPEDSKENEASRPQEAGDEESAG